MNNFSSLKIGFIAGMLGQGGAERQLFHIVKTLQIHGGNIDVYSFQKDGYWEKPLLDLGVNIYHISSSTRRERLLEMNYQLKKKKYDFIHSQHFYTNLYSTIISNLNGYKNIGSVRNDVFSEVKGMGIIMGWLSLILPTHLVANSMLAMKNAKKLLRNPNTMSYLPNFVDANTYFPRKEKNQGFFKIITVGTIWRPKRIERVIFIADMVKKRSNNIIFEIFGDGDQYLSMIDLANEKGLNNITVFFKGRSERLAEEYRNADLLLLTSDHEGTPNVVLEAMASGIPTISTKVGDVPYLIADNVTGYLFDADNLERAADLIISLSKNRDLAQMMGERSRNFILLNYSFSKLESSLLKLYGLAQ
jgi:glycosyltransferase involved in cell wall biosynthesis